MGSDIRLMFGTFLTFHPDISPNVQECERPAESIGRTRTSHSAIRCRCASMGTGHSSGSAGNSQRLFGAMFTALRACNNVANTVCRSWIFAMTYDLQNRKAQIIFSPAFHTPQANYVKYFVWLVTLCDLMFCNGLGGSITKESNVTMFYNIFEASKLQTIVKHLYFWFFWSVKPPHRYKTLVFLVLGGCGSLGERHATLPPALPIHPHPFGPWQSPRTKNTNDLYWFGIFKLQEY